MKNQINKLIESAVISESVLQECRQKYQTDLIEQLNNLLIDKAKECGVSLYEVCASYVPKVTIEIIEHDWFKEKREWPDMGIRTTIKLVRRK